MDNFFEQMLHTSPVVASGRDGIILQVNISNFGPEDTETMRQNGIEITADEYALKMLKIYRPGDGAKEYQIQKEAYEILAGHDDMAHVPKPIVMKLQQLSEHDREYLRSYAPFIDNEAELILMDFIEGTDLATYIYNFILSRNGYDEQMVANMSFEQKHSLIGGILNFEKAKNADSGDFRELYALRENMRKLMIYLKKKDFHIDQNFLDKIKNAVELLEAKGIFHNDLHDRNVMIGKDGNPYIIDFGRSVRDKSDQESDDIAIVRRYEELNKTEKIDGAKEWLDIENKILKSERWLKILEKMESYLLNGEKNKVVNCVISESADDNKFLNYLGVLIILFKKTDQKNDVLDIIEQLGLVLKREFLKAKLSDLKKYLSN